MTNEFVLYGVPISPYVRSVALVLEEKGANFQMRTLIPNQSKIAAFPTRHPFGRVPVMVHGGFQLYETQAILRYLDRIISVPSLTPENPQAEARMNQLCGITDCYVMQYISKGISFGRILAPKLGIPTDESLIKASIPHAEVCVAEISRILGTQSFLTGEHISLADLLLAPHLSVFQETPESTAILAPYPALHAWIDKMSERPSFRNTTKEKLGAKAQADQRTASG